MRRRHGTCRRGPYPCAPPSTSCAPRGALMPLLDRGIHFEALGDARNPPLLLIMGLAVSSRAWDRLPEILSRRFQGLGFDNRGTGRASRRRFGYRMRDLARDPAAALHGARVSSASA